jgi:hypothetical protein
MASSIDWAGPNGLGVSFNGTENLRLEQRGKELWVMTCLRYNRRGFLPFVFVLLLPFIAFCVLAGLAWGPPTGTCVTGATAQGFTTERFVWAHIEGQR